MKARLIKLLQRDEDAICDAWMERLSETARLAGEKMSGPALTPVRVLLRDLVRVLESKPPRCGEAAPAAPRLSANGMPNWQVNLTYAVEVLLTGEVVIRKWVYIHLDPSDRQQVELFEQINHGFHELLRAHTLQYCQTCHNTLSGQSAAQG